MDSVKRWTAQPTTAHQRLDQYLAEIIPDQSRSQIQTWIRKGLVRVNGGQVKTGHIIRACDEITLERPRAQPSAPRPEPIPLQVIYDNGDLAVIEKPAGMVCHSGAGIHSGTVVNALLYHLGPIESFDATRPGIVHRLDKFTSGVMVVAKNTWSHGSLAQQFKSREVKKEYLALVYGFPDPPGGMIDLPIGRDLKDRKKISVRARKKRSAVTHYRQEKNYGPFSLLRVRIVTGRTHQIRVHLAQKGHPVVGDSLYGGKRISNLPPQLRREVQDLGRVFLHASRLEFRHPRTGKHLVFTSPLPAVLEHFLARVADASKRFSPPSSNR